MRCLDEWFEAMLGADIHYCFNSFVANVDVGIL